jgi:hypothetical protein
MKPQLKIDQVGRATKIIWHELIDLGWKYDFSNKNQLAFIVL